MKQVAIFSALLFVFTACGKDKFQTTPQLKIKSVNTHNVSSGQPLVVNIEFTDKEGDVSDSFFIIRQRLNAKDPFSALPVGIPLPKYPKAVKGEFQVNLDYFTVLTTGNYQPIHIPGSVPPKNEPDTMLLKFVAKDKGGHYSDTATLDNIFVERL